VIPEGIVDTLWFEVEERCRDFGDQFDTWQDGLGQVVLGLRADGSFAATVGGITMSIPRQVAKTFIVMRIVVALCTLFPDLTVIWTAHRMRTATNTFQKMKAFVLRQEVRGYLRAGSNQGTAIRDANGEQEIPFANGSKILFGAREQGFGRGFDEVDIEVFDEAQILTIKALEDMVAATNQSRFPHGALLFYMGTPPRPEDPGEMFAARRREALEHKAGMPDFGEPVAAGDALYVECSADANVGAPGGPGLDSPEQVEKANPSYPHRTPPVSVKRLRKNLPNDDAWRREGLGVWDDDNLSSTITKPVWSALGTTDVPSEGRKAFAVKFSVDGSTVSLCAALQPDEGPVHVELVDRAPMSAGLDWIVRFLAPLAKSTTQIVVDGKAGTAPLVTALNAAGVRGRVLITPTTEQVTAAHATFLQAVLTGDVRHSDVPGQKGLDDAALGADKRPIGTMGGFGWRPIREGVDVTPLEGVTFAYWAVTTSKRRPGRKAVLV